MKAVSKVALSVGSRAAQTDVQTVDATAASMVDSMAVSMVDSLAVSRVA